MKRELDLTADYIDVRDIIARVEELQETRDNLQSDFDDDEANAGVDFDNWVRNQPGYSSEEQDELDALKTILAELCGNGGDEQWEGDWYPVTLIRDSYFNEAMDEMLEDCGDLPKDLPCYLTITVDYKALQMDYASIEIDGVTYWYR